MKLLHTINQLCHKFQPQLFLLLLLTLLRLPNFSEPYWYGDEGIYLTLGNALRDGKFLYAEIIDHKTPLIYYFAMVPSQFWFRVLMFIWMSVTTLCFYHLVKKLSKNNTLISLISSSFFVLFTSLPWFEGHIPNGELFVMGFVIGGLVLLLKTNWFSHLVTHSETKSSAPLKNPNESRTTLIAGSLFGLAVLTKVPAIFDFGSVGLFAVLTLFLPLLGKKRTQAIPLIKHTIPNLIIFSIGYALPIIGSIAYFFMRGTAAAYFEYGLLYNFRYAGTWQPGFTHPVLIFFTTLSGKLSYLALTVIGVAILGKKISRAQGFAAIWTAAAVVAATLSNRPYPHYFLQVIPPIVLLVGLWLHNLKRALKSRALFTALSSTLLTAVVVSSFIGLLLVFKVGFYRTRAYYENYLQLVVGKISTSEYNSRFNYLMDDNYAAAEIISQSQEKQIFIWGTNPMLYALTGTYPSGRFTVSFHIADFNAYAETLEAVISDQPEFIVVMKDEKHSFNELFSYIEDAYIPSKDFTHFTLWKRINATVTP